MAGKNDKKADASTGQPIHVVDYIVQRLADEGITDCFGVPGDYAFPVCDAIARSPKVRWVGCSNELNAAYAADGYARVRGAAMLSTTFAVGELSAINGVMGAKAERSLVYHVVGMPSYQNQRLRKVMHHTFGDGAFDNVIPLSAGAACTHAVITPENCMIEMERVIAEARRNNQPAYIVVPSDYALTPVMWTEVQRATLQSNEPSLAKAIAAIADHLSRAKSVVALPAFTLSRLGLQNEARRVIEALGCPYATTAMEKCIIDESHPQFAGMYAGAVTEKETKRIVEEAEVVLDLGGVSLNDENTAAFSGQIDPARFVSIELNDVRIGDRVFTNVRLADVLAELAKLKPLAQRYQRAEAAAPRLPGKPSDKITMEALYPRYAAFIQPGDNVVLESGSTSFGIPPMQLADNVQVHIQMLWGSIGWATGAALGVALADPKRRTLLFTGEGSHQLTANEIGNMGRWGAKPIIFVLNNDGYMVERALEQYPDWTYNDLAKWRYADLPKALGCADWFTARVETLGELDAALKAARANTAGAYIEVIGGRMDMPLGLSYAHSRLNQLYGAAP
ncbi:Pyruvate decarboxylase [Labilithrix luteola]|uniref:Pyruvate decarboxylase n=1 Tax=Labilithrix luteola TaxID=1391654 RepID=A0A0K1Q7J9_9BACT|nr:thiamine pyrophosphate-binding protein [Labilithrix luteola]AKV01385.1 Pyruvate decarboxylase [Labilithrix luteola]